MDTLRALATKFVHTLADAVPASPERDAAVLRVEEALFHASNAVVRAECDLEPLAIAGHLGEPLISTPVTEPDTDPALVVAPVSRRPKKPPFGSQRKEPIVEMARVNEEMAQAARDGKTPLPGSIDSA